MTIMILIVILASAPFLVSSSFLNDNCNNVQSSHRIINIGAMFPFAGSWPGGVSCYPAAQLALAHVNCHQSRAIIDGFKLNLIVTNTSCEPGKGVKDLYEFLYESKDTPSAILGPGCSSVSTAVAEAAHLWNVLMVSYGSSSPALSDRKRFPTFFRTHPSALIHNPTRINLFSKFGWKRVFVLVHSLEVFTTTADDLTKLGKKNGIGVRRSNFQTHPQTAIQTLKAQDARIIVGLFYETVARQVFCEAYKAGLYGPKIVWFILGWFPDDWFHPRPQEKLRCTLEQMKIATEGHFTTEIMQLGANDAETFSGISPLDFQKRLLSRLEANGKNSGGFPESPLAYDAVWALAIAINNTIIELKRQGRDIVKELTAVPDTTVISERAFGLLKHYLDKTDFSGVSGNVSFSAGDRVSSVTIEFMSNGTYISYGSHTEKYPVVLTPRTSDAWPFNDKYKIPRDGIEMYEELDRLKMPVFVTIAIFAFIGILSSMGLLLFNSCVFKHSRVIYNSQPYMNSMMLLGCILTLFCVFLNGLTDEVDAFIERDKLCRGMMWMLSLGFTLGFGSLFAKIWARHVVASKLRPSRLSALAAVSTTRSRAGQHTTNETNNSSPTVARGGIRLKKRLGKRSSTDRGTEQYPLSGQLNGAAAMIQANSTGSSSGKSAAVNQLHMYWCLLLLVAIDILFLSVQSVVAPLSLQTEYLETRNATSDGEVRVRPYIQHCRSTDHMLWSSLLLGYKGLLLLLGALFAYDSRNVQLENMNDSRQVAMSVYNIVTLFWITVPVMMLIKAHQDASYIFSSLAAILSVFVTQAFIFGPKIRSLIDNDMLPDLLEKANIKQQQLDNSNGAGGKGNNVQQSSNKLRVSREGSSRRKRHVAANRKMENAAAAAVELEKYNELVAENELIKRQIAEVDDYLDKLRGKYEELAKCKLEATLRKRAPPGRVPLAEIDFFTEFMYIDCEDLNNMHVTQI